MRSFPRLASFFSRQIVLTVGLSMLTGGLLVLAFQFVILQPSPVAQAKSALHPFTITSANFHDGGRLSRKQESNAFGCTGGNIAPELNWENAPSGTQSFTLLMSDNDAPLAGGFHHWVVYNIPGQAHELEGNAPFTSGTNSAGQLGYFGPCPPATGETHHYQFLLYALDVANIGAQGQTFTQVMSTIQNHVLSATSIIGTFDLP